MVLYRKRPVALEAMQWTGSNVREIMDFMAWRNVSHDEREGLRIHTLEGVHDVRVNDWIIKGVNGEFYNIRDDIFAATYEPVL